MAFFQKKQLRHIASGQVFDATPALELSKEYEVYCEEGVVHDHAEIEEVAPRRRGRPPKTVEMPEEVTAALEAASATVGGE